MHLVAHLEGALAIFAARERGEGNGALMGTTNTNLETLVFGIDMLVVVPEGTAATEIR